MTITINGYLTLRKCAYIFDSTHNNYFYGTMEQYQIKQAIQAELKKYYNNPDKRAEQIPYTHDETGNYSIIINNQLHRLNALQIASISDTESVINYRRNISVEDIEKLTPHYHPFCKNSLYSNKYRTLYFEFYTGADDLGYIRVHFKGSHEQFIIDDRTGKLFTSGEHGLHQPTTAEYIRTRLGIESESAKAEFFEVINAVTKEATK